MKTLQHMQELDMPVNMKIILCKLPYKMREKWRAFAYDVLETSKHRARFQDLVAFIERQVKILSDPLFGDIQNVTSAIPVSKVDNRLKSQPIKQIKGNSFAATVTPMNMNKTYSTERLITTTSHDFTVKPICVRCTQRHTLEECQQFQRKKHRDKMLFLKEKRLCFG